jgi:serine/threonine protein kinase/Flp pilus assembly protein TadD
VSDALEDLIAEFLERRDAGEAISAEEFAREHPDVTGLVAALRAACATDALLPGQSAPAHIGPYHVLAQLGSGGGGRVLQVEHRERPGEPLALKLLPLALRGVPRAVERFRREAAALGRLRHPGIVRVLEVGEHEGNPFLVMQFVAGEALSARIASARQKLLTPAAQSGAGARANLLHLSGGDDGVQRAAHLVAELARSVHAAHQQGVVHRDLKPSNVILRAGDHRPVLIDFGLAGSDDAATLTATGDLLGTPSFMAPEQARGEAADARADVYGVGAVLYEMLTLHVPHAGEGVHDVLERVLRAPARPVRQLDPHIPRTLEAIVRRAMAFRRARRYASAQDLADALEAFASGGTSGAPALTTLSLGARIEDFFAWHGRKVRAAVVAAVVVAGLGAGCRLWSNDRAQRARVATSALIAAHVSGDAEAPRAARGLLDLDASSAVARYVLARAQTAAPAEGDDFYRALHAGEDLLAKKEAAKAVAVLAQAVELRRDDPLAVALLGLAAARARDLDRAERELSAAVRLLPQCSKLFVELAWVHRRRNRFDLAVQAMRDAVAIVPADAEYWHDLARMLAYAERPTEALAAVERALVLSGGNNVRFLHTKGAQLNGLGRSDEAIAVLRQVAERAPTVEHRRSLALALDKAHRITEAKDAYLHTLQLEPTHLPTLLALVHLHAGANTDCAECVAYFAAHRDLLDPALVEEYALRALAADRGEFEVAGLLAAYLVRVGRTPRFLAEVDALLRGEFEAAALGRLVQARRTLVDGK